MIPEAPGPKPAKPAALKKGPAPRKEDYLENIGNSLDGDLREKVKCGLSPSYNEYRQGLEKLNRSKPGDEVIFGRYLASHDGRPQPISWQVLAREGKRLLVISKYGIDCRQYNKELVGVTWEQCSLRKWLNKQFLHTAFNVHEQHIIPRVSLSADKNPSYNTDPGRATEDQIFLLSIPEVNRYFKSDKDRKCRPTKYAVERGCYVDSTNKTCWWDLRSPGSSPLNVAFVYTDGAVDGRGGGVDGARGAVRPALWINLDS